MSQSVLKNIKSHFPIFTTHPKLHYLDSGATTQIPQIVLDAMNDYYTRYRANTHRGMYDLSVKASQAFQASRASLASFINAEANEIIFTSGTTHGLNALAYTLSPRLSHRDNVVLTRMEHHANLVPWQQMAKHYGFELRFIEITPEFRLDMESAKKLIDENTKIVSFTLASNVLGTVTPAKEIIKLVREKSPKAYTVIDAAQAIAHFPIDVKDLDCDFLVFSGHKMYGPTGTGVLYGKKVMLEEHIEPFLFGGDMVLEVTYENATWTEVPQRFEAGTQNIASVIGLGAACKFINEIGWEQIVEHEKELVAYGLEKLQTSGVQVIGPATPDNRVGALAFVIPGVHPHDIGEVMSSVNVAIRAGNHCAMPLHRLLGLFATARGSLGVYNTKEDIDALVEGITKAKTIFTA